MKKYRSIIILTVILIISTLICINVYANNEQLNASFKTERYYVKTNNDKTRTFKLENEILPRTDQTLLSLPDTIEKNADLQIAKSNTQLKYKNTVNYTNNLKLDVYTDENSNEYYYDQEGRFDGYSADRSLVNTVSTALESVKLTDEQLTELAFDYSKALLGDKASGFEIKNIRYDKTSNIYTASLVKKFGEGDFIVGPWIFVDVMANGTLVNCTPSRLYMYDDFDFKRLNGISEQMIEEYVNKQVYSTYSEDTEHQIDTISLVKKNNKFYILAVTDITVYDDNGNECFINAEYYYEFD